MTGFRPFALVGICVSTTLNKPTSDTTDWQTEIADTLKATTNETYFVAVNDPTCVTVLIENTSATEVEQIARMIRSRVAPKTSPFRPALVALSVQEPCNSAQSLLAYLNNSLHAAIDHNLSRIALRRYPFDASRTMHDLRDGNISNTNKPATNG